MELKHTTCIVSKVGLEPVAFRRTTMFEGSAKLIPSTRWVSLHWPCARSGFSVCTQDVCIIYPYPPPPKTYLFDNGRKSSERNAMMVFACDHRTAQLDDQSTGVFQLAAVGEGRLLLFTESAAFLIGRLRFGCVEDVQCKRNAGREKCWGSVDENIKRATRFVFENLWIWIDNRTLFDLNFVSHSFSDEEQTRSASQACTSYTCWLHVTHVGCFLLITQHRNSTVILHVLARSNCSRSRILLTQSFVILTNWENREKLHLVVVCWLENKHITYFRISSFVTHVSCTTYIICSTNVCAIILSLRFRIRPDPW